MQDMIGGDNEVNIFLSVYNYSGLISFNQSIL